MRVPHPFALFAKGWEPRITVSVSNNKNQFDSYAYDANGTYDAANSP